MKRFEIYGIARPAKVYFPGLGEIVLDKLTDEKAEELFLKGCPFLKPVPEYRHKLNPAEKPIVTTPLPLPQTGGGLKTVSRRNKKINKPR